MTARVPASLSRVLLGATLALLLAPASARPGSVVECSASSPNFCWAGGPVQHHPRIYMIFWGPKWGTDRRHLDVLGQLMAVFGDLSGRQYNNILTQYGDSRTNADSAVHNDTTMFSIPGIDHGVPNDGLGGLNPVDVIREVNRLAADPAYQWDTSAPDSQFLVFPQEGTQYLQFPGNHFCGYHSSGPNGMVYGVVKFATDGACDFMGNTGITDPTQKLINNMVWTALHEYTEMATEPQIPLTGSWKTKDSGTANPTEVADLCESLHPDSSTPKTSFFAYPDTFTFYVPYLWSSFEGRCVLAAGQEFSSPDNSGSFHGKHTVQGSILNRYLQLGAAGSFLGAPVSEEIPIAGGAVSYFAGSSCGGGGPFGSGSALYYGPGTPAPSIFEVHGCIYHEYARQGGPASGLGFPISDEYAIPGGRASDFQHGTIVFDNFTGQSLTRLGGGEPAVGMNGDGRLEVFEWRSDGSLWHKWQTTTGGGWSGWASLGCCISGPPAVRANDDKRLEVFARGTDGALWHRWQTSPGGGWSGWATLGGVFRGKPAVSWNVSGRLEVFVRGTDNNLYHQWQTSPGGGWSGWASLGCCIISSPAENFNIDGRLEVAAVGTDNAAWHIWQTTAGGGWSGWYPLGGVLTSDLIVSRNYDGRLEIFGRGSDAGLYHIWQVTRGGGWSGWAGLGCCEVGPPSAAINILDGRLEAFMRGTDNVLWHKWQVTTGGAWSGWASLGGVLTSSPVAVANFDARLEVFVRGTDGALWHNWQLSPGGGWSGWNRL